MDLLTEPVMWWKTGGGTLSFEFSYYYKENGGKHTAINVGVAKAKGEWIFLVDDDDYLLPRAIENVERWIRTLPNDGFAGVSGLKGYSEQDVVGERPAANIKWIDCLNTERRENHLRGDKAEVYKTDIMRAYPFPEFEGEKFLSEKAVWNQIAMAGYKMRWYNEIIYICHYLEGGLSDSARMLELENWRGITYCANIDEQALVGRERYISLFMYMKMLFIKYGKWVWIRKYVPNLTVVEAMFLNATFPLMLLYSKVRRFVNERIC